MGLFDLFKSKNGGEKPSPAAKWAEALTKRAQAYDRQEAITELCKLRTSDAVEALLRRFTFMIDPSITDQEEKEQAYEGIVSAGKEAIEPVRAFAAKAESLAWPTRVIKSILGPDEAVDELITWLSKWDVDYSKFIDPKLQILAALQEYVNPKIKDAIEPFLKDSNESARFHAVATTLAQKNDASIPALVEALIEEESLRIRTKIGDGFAQNHWCVSDDKRDAVRRVLPSQFGVGPDGAITSR